MVKHNGRLSMKQFMPMKPVKRGIKVWECAEASSGFVCFTFAQGRDKMASLKRTWVTLLFTI